jgi:hypothetical protein
MPGDEVENLDVGAWFVDAGRDKGFVTKSIAYSKQNTIAEIDLSSAAGIADELYVCWTATIGGMKTGRLELRDISGLKARKDNWVSTDGPAKKKPVYLSQSDLDCRTRSSLASVQQMLAQN